MAAPPGSLPRLVDQAEGRWISRTRSIKRDGKALPLAQILSAVANAQRTRWPARNGCRGVVFFGAFPFVPEKALPESDCRRTRAGIGEAGCTLACPQIFAPNFGPKLSNTV